MSGKGFGVRMVVYVLVACMQKPLKSMSTVKFLTKVCCKVDSCTRIPVREVCWGKQYVCRSWDVYIVHGGF